ncbi:MAG: TolB family protein, partial [Myxococcales bacterium]
MLNDTVHVHGAVISRDGARVAWVEQVATPDGPAWDQSLIQVQDLKPGAQALRIGAGKAGEAHDEGDLAFSPDGGRLAFLSDAEKKRQPQLYLADLRSGEVRQLTHVDGHLAAPRFSPDGKTIAVLFIEGGADLRGPVAPAARITGVVDEQIREQRIAVVPADGSAPLQALSPADLFVYEFDWRPDGGAFAAIGARGSGDDNWWVAQLYLVDAAGAARVLHKPALQICEARFSPDGKRIAFIEGLMSDQGLTGGDIWLVPAGGGAAR